MLSTCALRAAEPAHGPELAVDCATACNTASLGGGRKHAPRPPRRTGAASQCSTSQTRSAARGGNRGEPGQARVTRWANVPPARCTAGECSPPCACGRGTHPEGQVEGEQGAHGRVDGVPLALPGAVQDVGQLGLHGVHSCGTPPYAPWLPRACTTSMLIHKRPLGLSLVSQRVSYSRVHKRQAPGPRRTWKMSRSSCDTPALPL